ncbi:MAG: hypothetical protein ACXV49_04370 [Halobacteriota archaeon]
MMSAEMTDKKLFHCQSVDDVIFDLNGDRQVGLGWVIFEIDDEQHRQVTGAIGFSNNIFTLKLLRHLNAQQPLRIVGYFSNSAEQGAESYALDNIAPSGTLFSDEIGFILFRATALQIDTKT